ncbi:GNAT family N-acetyltransferase [Brachybacterium sp. UMB0905]|uniref:GNAT family N-acetyltransferase n=1 Tax=Brachybacterium sp. UMB0905 TaxID=2069310 RepID=UPI000C80A7F1|nr:GNAT family protein [Brachybacterium sp. UMB0905]PMC74475.1 N-acetyltransferase [Brachybacterium sp. UMB0905]
MTTPAPATAPEPTPAPPTGLADVFPPFGLVVRAGDLTMRLLQDADLPEYGALLRRPIFAEPDSPHVFPWYQVEPEERVRKALQFQWSLRSRISPEEWTLAFGIWARGRLIGCQDVRALRFAERRTVGSGSWLTLEEQGQGYGKLMRQAMLVLAFDHLGAEAAESAAIEGNARSFATSHACGYVDNGIGRSTMSGVDAMEQRFRVTPETFIRPAMPVEVEGLTPPLRAMLGA